MSVNGADLNSLQYLLQGMQYVLYQSGDSFFMIITLHYMVVVTYSDTTVLVSAAKTACITVNITPKYLDW